jgi:hypothetical protein
MEIVGWSDEVAAEAERWFVRSMSDGDADESREDGVDWKKSA